MASFIFRLAIRVPMYFLGHASFAYVPIAIYCLVRRMKLEPTMILAIFFFANLPDTMHFGPVRWLSHNTVGALILFTVFFLLFRRMGLAKDADMPLLGFAVGMHILTDTLFSSFILFFPFSIKITIIYGWGSMAHITWEAVSAMAFLTMLLLSGDWWRIRKQVPEGNVTFWKEFSMRKMRNRSLYPQYLYLLVGVLSIFQLAIALRLDQEYVDHWFGPLAMAAYFTYAALHAAMLMPMRDGVTAAPSDG